MGKKKNKTAKHKNVFGSPLERSIDQQRKAAGSRVDIEAFAAIVCRPYKKSIIDYNPDISGDWVNELNK